jgi:hypothetical protein
MIFLFQPHIKEKEAFTENEGFILLRYYNS